MEARTPASARNRDDVNAQITYIDLLLSPDPTNPEKTLLDTEDLGEVALLLQRCKYLLHGLLWTTKTADIEALRDLEDADIDDVVFNYKQVIKRGSDSAGAAHGLLRHVKPSTRQWASRVTDGRVKATGDLSRSEIRELADEATDLAVDNPASGYAIVWDFSVSLSDNDRRSASSKAPSRAGTPRQVTFSELPRTPSPKGKGRRSSPTIVTPTPTRTPRSPPSVLQTPPEYDLASEAIRTPTGRREPLGLDELVQRSLSPNLPEPTRAEQSLADLLIRDISPRPSRKR